MVREPDLETVNRTLAVQVQKLMEQLNEADARIRVLEARLADQERAAFVEMGR